MKKIREFVKEHTNDRDEPVSKFMVERLLQVYGNMIVQECAKSAKTDIPDSDGVYGVDIQSILDVSNLIK
jgi:hypothetical protein